MFPVLFTVFLSAILYKKYLMNEILLTDLTNDSSKTNNKMCCTITAHGV